MPDGDSAFVKARGALAVVMLLGHTFTGSGSAQNRGRGYAGWWGERTVEQMVRQQMWIPSWLAVGHRTRNRGRRGRRTTGVALLLNTFLWTMLVLTACDTAGVRFIDPPIQDEPERTVTIAVRLEDSALATALGWEEGVPGAQISYYRILGESGILTAETDSTGKVSLGGCFAASTVSRRTGRSRTMRPGPPTGGSARSVTDSLFG